MNDQLIIAILTSMIWLVPALLFCLWMWRDYERRIGRPARVSHALAAARSVGQMVEQIDEDNPELASNPFWQWVKHGLAQSREHAFWEGVARMPMTLRIVSIWIRSLFRRK